MGVAMDVEAIADSTRDLLRELAAVTAETEALRREMELAWGCDEDQRPTLIPEVEIEIELELDPKQRDTLPA
jgi:hypothetical protein